MADGKFAGLRTVRQSANEADHPAENNIPAPTAQPKNGRGRAAGKRSDPDWKLYSHFLRKSTQREAMTLLRAKDERRDLSDVLQELLQQWVSKQP